MSTRRVPLERLRGKGKVFDGEELVMEAAYGLETWKNMLQELENDVANDPFRYSPSIIGKSATLLIR